MNLKISQVEQILHIELYEEIKQTESTLIY